MRGKKNDGSFRALYEVSVHVCAIREHTWMMYDNEYSSFVYCYVDEASR